MAEDPTSSPPRDTFNLAYSLYFLLGASYLLTWHTFISAIDYFSLIYPWGNVNRVFTLAFNLPSVISVLWMTFLGLRVSSAWRVNSSLLICLVMLGFVPVMNSIFISDTEGSVATYAITVVAVALCGAGHVVMYGSLVASAGRYLPRRYLHALAAGAGASGIILNILRVITKAVMPQTESGTVASAYLYFAVCVLIMAIGLITYNLEDKLPVIWYYKYVEGSGPLSEYLLAQESDGLKSDGSWNGHGLEFYKRVWGHIQGYALSVAFIFIVTISIFPGHLTEDLTSSYFGDWYAIILLLCKNGFDIIARMLPSYSIFMTERKSLVIGGSIARVVFYPLYYLCLHGPAFFQSEVYAIAVTCIFGFTGGYFTCVLLILGPKSVPLEEAEVAGSLMVALLHIGDAIGSIVEWVWVL